jgi:hypothetical protein
MFRALAHFFLIGGLLFAARTGLQRVRPPAQEISIEVASDADDAEVEQKVREVILLREARKYQWVRRDPIIFQHLVRNMRFIEAGSQEDDTQLFARALELQLHERDPVVKARLLHRARAALSRVPEEEMPSEQALEAHRKRYSRRFEREGELRLEHVFLSRSRRPDSLDRDAARLAAELSARTGEELASLGDPLPGLRPVQSLRPTQWRASYGEPFADAVTRAEIGSWYGPVPSVYGLHFVRVLGRAERFLPPLEQIEAEVRADFLADKGRALAEQRLDALRNAYTVQVRRWP